MEKKVEQAQKLLKPFAEMPTEAFERLVAVLGSERAIEAFNEMS